MLNDMIMGCFRLTTCHCVRYVIGMLNDFPSKQAIFEMPQQTGPKTEPNAKPFLSYKQNSFLQERFCIWPRLKGEDFSQASVSCDL